MNMLSNYYIFIAISRYVRIAYFCATLFQYYEVSEGEIDRQINVIVMTMLLIVIINSGIFVEIENSMAIKSIHYEDEILTVDGIKPNPCKDTKLVFEDNIKKPLYFNQGLYYVIVTIFTVGYGDINAEHYVSQICTILLLLVTLVIIPY